jgi:colicin import membrane protein
MLKELLKNPTALFYAVLVHAVLIAILVFSIQWNGKPAPLQGSEKIVQATVIDEGKLEAEKQRKLEEAQRQRDEAEAKREAEAEKQRQAALEQQRAEEAQRKKQQAAERQRQAKLKTEQQAKRAAEQKRQAELAAQRQAAEAQRKAEEAKRQAEAKRKADEARRQKENLEMMRQQMAQEEADRAAQAAAAQRQRELASLRDQYANAIAQKVERNWIHPAAAVQPGSCRVRVKQIPGGDVVSVDASACTGDPSYRQSVEAAVFRAAPLPQPPDPAVFDRDIIFTFKPNQ